MIAPLPAETRRVLQLMATGLSSHEVADQLGMPVEDVRRHLVRALNHLGARSKLDAVIKAAQHGLIEL